MPYTRSTLLYSFGGGGGSTLQLRSPGEGGEWWISGSGGKPRVGEGRLLRDQPGNGQFRAKSTIQ